MHFSAASCWNSPGTSNYPHLPDVTLATATYSGLYDTAHREFSALQHLTPQCRVLIEKITVAQLAKKSSAFYGTHRFITMFTRAHH